MGVLMSYLGAHKIFTGEDGVYRGGVPIPAWTSWLELPFGILLLLSSIRLVIRDWRNPKPEPPVVNLDEEAARAEAAMDAMYLREHGKLPEKPKKDA